jgi:DNA-binding XRE family transcriptional regulator
VRNGCNYEPLRNYLSRPYFAGQRFTLSFDEIDSILGTPLPQAARANRAWWSNRKASWQASAWRCADCRVMRVDLVRELVTFHKPADYRLRGPDGSPGWDRFRIRSLRRHMGLNQAAFAQLLMVRHKTVSNLETGLTLPADDISLRLTGLAQQSKFPG